MDCLARDNTGLLLEARSWFRHGIVDPTLAEVIGIREALSWIKTKDWATVILESDSLVCVQALRSGLTMDSYFGSFIQECRLLCLSLPHVSIFFVKRSANKAAHSLARVSYSFADRSLSVRDLDPVTASVVLQDCY